MKYIWRNFWFVSPTGLVLRLTGDFRENRRTRFLNLPTFLFFVLFALQRRTSAQRQHTHHIMYQGVPQGDRPNFDQASHAELLQIAVASQGVNTFRRRGPLLIDFLGLRRGHPLPPCAHCRAVVMSRIMITAVRIFRFLHRGVHRSAFALHLSDIFLGGESAVDQRFIGHLFIPRLMLFDHRRQLPPIAAAGNHLHTGDDLCFRVRGQLHVISRVKTAVGHLHCRGLWISRRNPGFSLFRGLFLGLHFRQALQSLLHSLQSFPRCPLSRRLLSCPRRSRIGLQFFLQFPHLLLGFLQGLFQCRPTMKGMRSSNGPHPPS